tara:strand:+ start:2922 stop:4988 length:2067 start_codon:yes stop_codon:yes gene_type:complete
MTIQNIKGTLARLLATENLIVEHKKCETAQFNVETRVLTLPIWENFSNTVYDLLVGHEVGHALFTPNEDFTNLKAPQSYLNVTEDARIEKLMKRKFPGLNKTFFRGYTELMELDFFDVKDTDLSKIALIDRINLYFKGNRDIEFSFEEQPLVDMTSASETFDEAIEAAEAIYAFMKKEQEKKKEDKKDVETPQMGNQGGGSDPENQSTDVETSEEGESEEPSMGSSGSHGGEDLSEEINIDDVLTDESLQEKLKEAATKYGADYQYYEVPKINLDSVIVPNKEVWDCAFDYWNQNFKIMDVFENKYRNFKKDIQKEVNYLVKEFECKKSADSYARATTSRTGVLDTTKLHTFKFNDDLFKKVTVLPDGKNHGLIFVLDWSGSMGNVLQDTVKQLLSLVFFCRKVNIPFEVYSFTNEWFKGDDTGSMYSDRSRWNETPHMQPGQGKLCVNKWFNLMNMLTHKVNAKDFERQCMGMYILAHGIWPQKLGLSGTPLNEAIVSLHTIIPQFKKENGIQKLHVSILTDGESAGIPYYSWVERKDDEGYWGNVHTREDVGFIRNRSNGHVYQICGRYTGMTKSLLCHLSDIYPEMNLIGFRLVGSGEFNRFLGNIGRYHDEKLTAEFRKNKSVAIEGTGYVKYFAINANSLANSVDFDVEEGAKKSTIRSAFKKSLANKKLNKKILSQFVELVA